ncbi:hypothetical protein Hanom_Chr09g00786981 [Helianthus anomalus]
MHCSTHTNFDPGVHEAQPQDPKALSNHQERFLKPRMAHLHRQTSTHFEAIKLVSFKQGLFKQKL